MSEHETRPAAVAGSFYPSDPRQLRTILEQLFNATSTRDKLPRAIIAPHAGYQFSGALAAHCYAPLCNAQTKIRRVLLLGPSHHVGFRGIAASSHTQYATPLGNIPIDAAAIKYLLDHSLVGFLDDAHENEHSVEVHLPFLQHALDDFQLIPLVVGDASSTEVAKIIDYFWQDPSTLIVVSTDLSHFHTKSDATRLDRLTADKILQLNPSLVGKEACGCRAVNGLLQFAKHKQLSIKEVALTTSADNNGDEQRVVGYGGFHFYSDRTLTTSERQQALSIARTAIEHGLNKTQFELNHALYQHRITQSAACFVSLHIEDKLRGCIGSLRAHRPLYLDIANNAQAAAFNDSRFAPLTPREYRRTAIELSILSIPEPLGMLDMSACLSRLRPGTDGLILKQGQRQATYLPSVWQQIPDARQFVRSLRQKAGLDPDQWQDCEVWRYQTDTFS